MGDEVRLVDLEVIKRYSLAVRQETAPAEDLLAVLDESRDAVLAAMNPARGRAKPAAKPAARPKKAPSATGNNGRRRGAGR